MIVKFLAKSKTFKGVRYNTGKIEKNKGELMKVCGFGVLQGMSQLMPQDYINYLAMVSSRSKKVVYPQLHAVISAKGKSHGKEELTKMATAWMEKMGYGDQPYLVIFHKDTRNSHVHIVSTRVDRVTGKKINSAFEKVRAVSAMNRILKTDETLKARSDLEIAMAYNFQTKAQFMMILESKGYVLKEDNGKLDLIKFGKVLLDTDLTFLNQRIQDYQVDQKRASQITALLHKFKKEFDVGLRLETVPVPGGLEKSKSILTSEMAVHLKQKFGVQLLFHGKEGMAPYGYSVLDHASGNVFKGGEIMDLSELLTPVRVHTELEMTSIGSDSVFIGLDVDGHSGFSEIADQLDSDEKMSRGLDFSGEPVSAVQQFNVSSTPALNLEDSIVLFEEPICLSISDDIDDEAIHGRRRNKKSQGRSGSR